MIKAEPAEITVQKNIFIIPHRYAVWTKITDFSLIVANAVAQLGQWVFAYIKIMKVSKV